MKQVIIGILILFACSLQAEEPRARITMGNGDNNWITTEGIERDGSTFTVPELHISGNGWLVMHPFKDGKPDGEVVAGSTYVPSGTSQQIDITVDGSPNPGDHFIVMLHRDVDEDEHFDFVFVGDTGMVEDEAVFEGSKMIGHIYQVE